MYPKGFSDCHLKLITVKPVYSGHSLEQAKVIMLNRRPLLREVQYIAKVIDTLGGMISVDIVAMDRYCYRHVKTIFNVKQRNCFRNLFSVCI